MKKILLSLATATISLASFAQCTDLYFSEYIEGSSQNKALEIYNPTSSAISLSTYSVKLYSNGGSSANSTLNLTGSLNAGAVYVISHSSSNASILAIKDTTHGVANYNGDDAIVLLNGTNEIDVFGVVGTDPGSSWNIISGGTTSSAANQTLVRKPTVNTGSTTWFGSGETEWDVHPIDEVSFLGSHTANGCGTSTTPLVAGITLSEDTICLGTAISYTGTVSGGTAPYSTVVNFGDGSTNSSTLTGSYTYTTAGTYTLVYTATDDAIPSLTDDSTITVVVNSCVTPLESVITLSEDTICLGTTITYNTTTSGGTAPYSYSVDYGDGSAVSTTSTGSHTYATAGTYSLVYTVTDDAIPSLSKDSTITVVVDACSSINEEKENAISVYPNPSKDGLVNLSNVEANSTVTVFNVIGEVVFSTIANNNQQLNLSSLNKGSYFVTIANNNKSITKKLIIE